MKRIFVVFLCLFLLSGCAAGGNAGASSTRYLTAMDTVMSLTAYGENRDGALERSVAEIQRLDNLLSIGNENSDISRLNREKNAALSPDTWSLLSQALDLAQDTQGVFDPTVYPLVKLWGFYDKDYHVPTRQELSKALALVDYREVSLSQESCGASLGKGQQIDLGGIGKGFASQRVTELFQLLVRYLLGTHGKGKPLYARAYLVYIVDVVLIKAADSHAFARLINQIFLHQALQCLAHGGSRNIQLGTELQFGQHFARGIFPAEYIVLQPLENSVRH